MSVRRVIDESGNVVETENFQWFSVDDREGRRCYALFHDEELAAFPRLGTDEAYRQGYFDFKSHIEYIVEDGTWPHTGTTPPPQRSGREPGFYWVQLIGSRGWLPALWSQFPGGEIPNGHWKTIDCEDVFDDRDMYCIGPRIKEPENLT